MANILVRGLAEETKRALKERAARNHRSLQQEVLAILEDAATDAARRQAAYERAEETRRRLVESSRVFSDSTELIREDRER